MEMRFSRNLGHALSVPSFRGISSSIPLSYDMELGWGFRGFTAASIVALDRFSQQTSLRHLLNNHSRPAFSLDHLLPSSCFLLPVTLSSIIKKPERADFRILSGILDQDICSIVLSVVSACSTEVTSFTHIRRWPFSSLIMHLR